MANNKFIEQYSKLPLVAQIGLPVGAYFLIIKPLLLGGGTTPPPPSNQTPASAANEVTDLQNQGETLTYPVSWYNSKADSMQQAMFDAGTDEDAIYNVFENCPKLIDVLKIIAVFGNRPYYTFGINYGNLTLSQWFAEELDSSEIDNINDILQGNGINYYF
jgi:hypothetical protein